MERDPQPPGVPWESDPRGSTPGADPRRLVRLACTFYGALFVAALLWRTGFGGEPLLYHDPGARAVGIQPLQDLAAGAAAGLGLVVLSRLWTHASARAAALGAELRALLGVLPTPTVLLLALLSGVAEEAFFRGALQPVVGLIPASLLFGLAHFVPRRGLVAWAPSAALAGLLLGALFQWTGNLLAPALAHALLNALNLHWLTRSDPPAALGRRGV